MAESLASDAKQQSHSKASFLSMASQTMRGYLDKDRQQFRAYFLALFAEKQYTRVLDRILKVDKSLCGDRTGSQFPPGRSYEGPLTSSAIICDFCVFRATLRLRAFAVCPSIVPVGVAFPLTLGLRVAALVFSSFPGLPCITFASCVRHLGIFCYQTLFLPFFLSLHLPPSGFNLISQFLRPKLPSPEPPPPYNFFRLLSFTPFHSSMEIYCFNPTSVAGPFRYF